MSARFSSPVCVKGQHNRSWRKRYAGYPDSFARHLEEILPLMAYVVEEVERRDLPGEFALLPIVESWYRPAAIGPGGPAGMWQMISSTARNHGIRIQSGYDGRLSPVESTDAALSYLQTLDAMFDGEWRAMAMGRTLTYRINGELWAFEHYLPGTNRVTLQLYDGSCLHGTWDYTAPLYCFHWEGQGTSCFRHARLDGGILIVETQNGQDTPLTQDMSGVTDLPLTCGPAVTS